MEENNLEIKPRATKKKAWIALGITLLVLLLGSAAYVAGRLLNGQGLPGITSGGPAFSLGSGGEQGVRISMDDIQPASELPKTAADARGIFDHRQNNSIFLGTGRVTISAQTDQSGKVETTSEHDGPEVEVVVTAQTKIFKDVTMLQFDGPPPEGQKIQQVVEPGTLDEIGEASMVTVWGRKTGDRFIADVLVYSPPAFMMER